MLDWGAQWRCYSCGIRALAFELVLVDASVSICLLRSDAPLASGGYRDVGLDSDFVRWPLVAVAELVEDDTDEDLEEDSLDVASFMNVLNPIVISKYHRSTSGGHKKTCGAECGTTVTTPQAHQSYGINVLDSGAGQDTYFLHAEGGIQSLMGYDQESPRSDESPMLWMKFKTLFYVKYFPRVKRNKKEGLIAKDPVPEVDKSVRSSSVPARKQWKGGFQQKRKFDRKPGVSGSLSNINKKGKAGNNQPGVL
ncbi:hypothetical protein FNV43_RR12996 [Rhamnella rubrinervis]|uniref:Uncharacterized protein n=1 Tax=Rhamnella rubrinervis TaxID=2594499 RepID=A0A8K0MDE9_9ROSA|nr:hypothetical protein FNV43_RR12996 [Rhamnella rubrinervis]